MNIPSTTKKGQMQALPGLVIGIMIVAVVIFLTIVVLAQMNEGMGATLANTTQLDDAYAALSDTLDLVISFVGIIVIVAVIVIILMMLKSIFNF
jgi:type II secretory pathway component PulF